MGAALYEGIAHHDWSGVASIFADSISSAMSSLGPFGALAGGFLGGFIGDLFGGGLFGGGKKKSQPGDSPGNPMWTADIASQALLTRLVEASELDLLRSAAEKTSAQGEIIRGNNLRIGGTLIGVTT